MRITTTPSILTLAVAAAALLGAPAGASISHRSGGFPSVQAYAAQSKLLAFQNMRAHIGSAEAKTQALLRAHPGMVLPAHPLFVADPGLNAIVIFNMNGSGTQVPSAVLAGPNTLLNGPDSITTGWDQPCLHGYTQSDCTTYLYVANAGNDTVNAYTYPLTAANQAPYFTFSAPASCMHPGLGFPAGIEHAHPTAAWPQGYLVISDEGAATNGALEVYNVPTLSGQNCPIQDDTNPPDTQIHSASGLSLYGSTVRAGIYNANATTVTQEQYRAVPNKFFFNAVNTWAVGGAIPASTQGTAVDVAHGFLWVTTAKGMTSWPDGVWECPIASFPTGCSTGGPAITAGLSSPAFPKASPVNRRLYVPNLGGADVTSYNEASPFTLVATYVNLAAPWDVEPGA